MSQSQGIFIVILLFIFMPVVWAFRLVRLTALVMFGFVLGLIGVRIQ